MTEKILEVLEITVPVFAVIGLGKFLHVKKWLSDKTCHGINFLIANFSLPAIIFLAVAQTTFRELGKWHVIVGGLVPILVGLLVFIPLSFILKIKGETRAPFIYSPFWGNVSYMGIPLAIFAFGKDGGLNAAIINAFTMPLYVIIGTFIIGLHHHERNDSLLKRIKGAVFNPIPLSAIAGIIISLLLHEFGFKDALSKYALVKTTGHISVSCLDLIGKMGLPLALLSIGAALKINTSLKAIVFMTVACFGRLILTPLSSLFVIKYFFPSAPYVDMASCVLVMATPVAVASYVISTKSEVAAKEAGELVVCSTLLSILTIPIWVFILLSLKSI